MSYLSMLNVSKMTGLSRRVCFETFVRQVSVRVRTHGLDRVDPIATVVYRVHVVVTVEVVGTVVVVAVVVLTRVDDVQVVRCCSGHYTWSIETQFPVVLNALTEKRRFQSSIFIESNLYVTKILIEKTVYGDESIGQINFTVKYLGKWKCISLNFGQFNILYLKKCFKELKL